MSAIYTQSRGKVRVACSCGWQSIKGDWKEVHDELAHHNFEKHPGVFPRWNPHVQVIEQKPRGRHAEN